MGHRFKQLSDLARAMKLHSRLREFEFGTPKEVQEYQRAQLKRIVRHAVAHSPYYGRLCKDVDVANDFQLEDLPIVDKRLMMDNFDEWVTDPRLKLDLIEKQIETDPEEQYYLNEYRIVATSGSSGLRGLFVYDRSEWTVVIAAAFRWAEMFGTTPIELSYKKLASIKADKPTHATSRLGQSMDLGIRNLLMLDATKPVSELVRELNNYQPELLMGYASLISLLSVEQIEGHLRISPEMVATFSEMLGEDRIKRARDAWGLTPFNHYGAAEQVMIAADCDAHNGLHHFADMSIVEIVDENNNPVPSGVPGQKVLLTNLHKFVQPIIRYELTDIVTKSAEGCSCGRSFPLFSRVGGRAEDVIELPGENGKLICISPMLIFDCMLENANVIEYQYFVHGHRLNMRVVARKGVEVAQIEHAIKTSLASLLAKQGVRDLDLSVEFVESIARTGSTMGKLKLRSAT